jgi:hypothetical protein
MEFTKEIYEYIEQLCKSVKAAEGLMANSTLPQRNNALINIAKALMENTDEILKANAIDVENAASNGVIPTMIDRLTLNEARIKGIRVVLDKIAEFGGLPAVLMGDLNAEEDTETYTSAMEDFLDSKYQTENTMTSCTFQAWGTELGRDCIDYILVLKNGVQYNAGESHAVHSVSGTDIQKASDHYPVYADITFKKQK